MEKTNKQKSSPIQARITQNLTNHQNSGNFCSNPALTVTWLLLEYLQDTPTWAMVSLC